MVATWKPQQVTELVKEIEKAKVVGLVKISGIPSKQFQKIRKRLDGKAVIKVTKKSVMKRSLDKAGIKELSDHLDGSMGFIFTDLNPFKLNKILEENRESAPARKGDTAPADIVIPKGDTQLPPGPVIGEFQNAGIKAKIDAGKIVVMADAILVKEGEEVTGEVASVLVRLGVEPMEMGLDLSAVYEDGLIYLQDVLHIDEAETIEKLQRAYLNAFNLSINAGIYNKEVIKPLVMKAYAEAMNLAVNAEIFNKESIGILLSKANMQMLSLSSRIPDAVDKGLKQETAVEKSAAGEDEGRDKEEPKPETGE